LTKKRDKVQSFALNLFLIASAVVTPFYSFESINLPKFVVLIFFGSVAFIYIFLNLRIILLTLPKISKVLIFGFIATYLIVFISSETPWQQQLYGRENRRNGLLTYFCLILLFIIFHSLPYAKYLKSFVFRIAFAGVFVISYSILQLLKVDPFKWDSVNLHFFSTLGNPNFLSAHIAIVTIPILSLIYYNLIALPYSVRNLSVFIVLAIMIYLIYRTFSYQGFIALFASLGAFVLVILYKSKNRLYLIITFFVVVASGSIALAGTLNNGPLAKILYKGSVTSRGDFFRSAINSGNSNFFTGTGFDSFGDYYLLYRDTKAGERFGGEYTDSAHNYFLDLYATQGFFGLFFYALLTLVTLIAFVKLLKSQESLKLTVVLFSSWVAVQVQSLVSPTNLLFSILIFSISGFVIGSTIPKEESRRLKSNYLPMIFGIVFALAISISAISRENEILIANQKGLPEDYINALEIFPKSTVGYSRAINLFAQAGIEDKAFEISKKAISFNYRSPAAHLIIFTSPLSSKEEKIKAYKTLLELDPMNPNLKSLQP
jgi:O-antigen ligase